MIHVITERELPEEILPFYLDWKKLFMFRMTGKKIKETTFTGEDKNLRAFGDFDRYMDWFCDHPKTPEPYKDYGFYTRELTYLSFFIKPKVIVELGTNCGAGTLMLSNLNPNAKLYTVDNKRIQILPDEYIMQTGYIAHLNEVKFTFILGDSWETEINEKFNFCFIDADHSEEAVRADSLWAWKNKSDEFVIVWHDICDSCPSAMKALAKFSEEIDTPVYRLWDSHCAWTYRRN